MVTTQLSGQQLSPSHRRLFAGRGRSSLYARVVLVNAGILLLALLLLVLTPITVSSSVSAGQVALLLGAFAAMVVANAALLRVSFRGLIALTRRMETLDLLRPRERLSERGGAETRTLISGFNTMLDRLEADRRESTRRGVAALENERLRISRELHDEIGQRMTGIVLQLSRIHADVPDTVRSGVERVLDEARAVLGEIGALAWQIRPGILDDLGLLNALGSLAQSFGDSGTARIESVLPQQLPPMSSEVELAIYRITQEALTNAVRHSGATRISVRLGTTREQLTLQVIDNGRGLCDTDHVDPGLRGMRERALLIEARLGTHENPPHGLQVELVVPIAHLGGSP